MKQVFFFMETFLFLCVDDDDVDVENVPVKGIPLRDYLPT